MDDINQTVPESAPASSEYPRLGKMLSFARRHPALSLLGAAGVGLIGGLELATGVVIGAGVAALIGRGSALAPGEAHRVRDRARELFERAPHEVKVRARAVVQAARGEIPPHNGHNP